MTRQRGQKRTTPYYKRFYRLSVFVMVMITLIAIRDHYIADPVFQYITSCLLMLMTGLYLLSFARNSLDESAKKKRAYHAVTLVSSVMTLLMVLMMSLIVLRHLPRYVSLLGQVFQICFLVPLVNLGSLTHGVSFVTHFGLVPFASLDVLSLMLAFILLRTLVRRLARLSLETRTIPLESLFLAPERLTPSDGVASHESLGFFYRYSAYE